MSPSGPLVSPIASPRSRTETSMVPLPIAALPGSSVHTFSLAFFGGSTAPTFAVYEPVHDVRSAATALAAGRGGCADAIAGALELAAGADPEEPFEHAPITMASMVRKPKRMDREVAMARAFTAT